MVEPHTLDTPVPEEARGSSSCGTCSDESCSAKTQQTHESRKEFEDRQRLQRRLCAIEHKVIVMSGKGGVGKSTVAVNLASALVQKGQRVGLLDVDIHGPTVPTMLQLVDTIAESQGNELRPVEMGGLKVMSIGFLLGDPTEAVIWRGPRKAGLIKSFLQDVEWGELDYLIVDAPPGTGDEPLSVCQLIDGADGAVIVTTPQEVALTAVRKSVNFCGKMDMPVLGVVENMSGFACPHCGEVTDIFQAGGGEKMALAMNVPFLGRIPIDAKVGASGDEGLPFVDAGASGGVARAFEPIVGPILALSEIQDGTAKD